MATSEDKKAKRPAENSSKSKVVKTAKKPKAKVAEKETSKKTSKTAKSTTKKTSTKNLPAGRQGKKNEEKVVLRIRVRAYESKVLDSSVKQIIDTAMRYDAVIIGPVPLPTEIKKYTVNRASFIYKNAREQFEIRVHKRLIDILNPSPKTIEALTNLSLPSGVDIDVRMP